jgi:hypothetical protein
MLARVLKSYITKYPDPIEVRTGDQVRLGKHDTEYPGWIWATSLSTGRSGWIPEHFIQLEGDLARVRRDYSARELDVVEGDIVEVREEQLGWALVESSHGRGWVPLGCLARSTSPADLPL